MDDFDLFMFLAMNHDMMDIKLYTHTHDGHAGLSNAMLRWIDIQEAVGLHFEVHKIHPPLSFGGAFMITVVAL